MLGRRIHFVRAAGVYLHFATPYREKRWELSSSPAKDGDIAARLRWQCHWLFIRAGKIAASFRAVLSSDIAKMRCPLVAKHVYFSQTPTAKMSKGSSIRRRRHTCCRRRVSSARPRRPPEGCRSASGSGADTMRCQRRMHDAAALHFPIRHCCASPAFLPYGDTHSSRSNCVEYPSHGFS